MIIIFYVCMMVVGAVVLIYAIVTSAPIITERATSAWDWWRTLPVHELLILPLSEALKTPIPDYSALWDPWGAALGGVSRGCLSLGLRPLRTALDHRQYRR